MYGYSFSLEQIKRKFLVNLKGGLIGFEGGSLLINFYLYTGSCPQNVVISLQCSFSPIFLFVRCQSTAIISVARQSVRTITFISSLGHRENIHQISSTIHLASHTLTRYGMTSL